MIKRHEKKSSILSIFSISTFYYVPQLTRPYLFWLYSALQFFAFQIACSSLYLIWPSWQTINYLPNENYNIHWLKDSPVYVGVSSILVATSHFYKLKIQTDKNSTRIVHGSSFFILLNHERSRREVFLEFQPSFDTFRRSGLFRLQVPWTHSS